MNEIYKDRLSNESFMSCNFIKDIKDKPRWTITTNRPEVKRNKFHLKETDKLPINFTKFREDYANAKITKSYIVKGASNYKQDCVTLNEIYDLHPHLIKPTFYLLHEIDNFIVLDIEPSCPENLRQELLNTNFVYGEKSNSGQGYHLAYQITDEMKNLPDFFNYTVLKHESKAYEFLLQHWVLLTGIPIENKPEEKSIMPYLREIITQKEKQQSSIRDIKYNDVIEIAKIEIPKEINDYLNKDICKLTLADCNNDNSTLDFRLIKHYLLMLKGYEITSKNYLNDELRIKYVSKRAYDELPMRDKIRYHRIGKIPYLQYQTMKALSQIDYSCIDRMKKDETTNM